MKGKTSKNENVDAYFYALNPGVRGIARQLRNIVKEASPQIEESLKWGMPVYAQNGLVCCIMATKSHVSFIFYSGARLADPRGLFEGQGKKMRHVKLGALEDIRKAQFKAWVNQAVKLNLEK
jgi:hypothetical protein